MSLILGGARRKILPSSKKGFSPQKLFANNEPGVWYKPSDLTAEKVAWQRNLLTWSEDVTNSAWTKSAATITANTTTAPDGTTTADTLTDNATSNFHGVYQFISYAGPFTASLYVKYVNKQYVSFLTNNNGSSDRYAYFDLVNETVHSVNAQFTASVIDVGGGWLRLTVSGQSFTTASSYYWWNIALNTNTTLYLGDGTGQVQVWGAMVNPSAAVESYQRITDFTSDFLAAFPTHSLYQDSAGTTPVTALGQPVGLMLDQSRGGLANLGPELAATLPTPSIFNFGGSVGAWNGTTRTMSNTVTGTDNSYPRFDFALNLTVGATYIVQGRLSGDIASVVSYGIRIAASGTANSIGYDSTTGRFFGIQTAASTSLQFLLNGTQTAPKAVTINELSVRLVPGVHRIQPTPTSRPTLDARVNLLTYSEDFSNAVWTNNGGTVTANAAVAPDGTTTADLLVRSTSATDGRYQTVVFPGTGARGISIYVKAGTAATSYVWVYDATAVASRLEATITWSGAVPSVSTNVGSLLSSENVGNDWYRLTFVTASVTGSNVNRVYFLPAYTGSSNGQGAYFWGAQAAVATTAYPYQRVVTATDYADVGVPRQARHDGLDDSMYTASTLDLSSTDKVTVWAGVYKNSDAAQALIVENTASAGASNPGSFNILGPNTSGATNYGFRSGGTVSVGLNSGAGTYAAPTSNVVSMSGDIGADILSARINAAAANNSSSDQGTGNYANAVLYIGRRNNTNLPFNGGIYDIIVRGAATDADLIRITEQYIANDMRIVL